jgi:hypothetical protein
MAVLSDKRPCEVRRLHFLEIEDNVSYNVDPPYTHTYENGQEVQIVLTDWNTPPQKPNKPFSTAQPGTELYALWETYNLYQAVLLHERRRARQTHAYLIDVARYVKNNCLKNGDGKRIITAADYEAISAEAICPEVTREDLEAELASTFQGILGRPAGAYGLRTD